MSHTFGAVAVLVVSVLTVGHRHLGAAVQPDDVRLLRRLAHRTSRPQRERDRRRVPLRRVLPRRRRAGARLRRRHALVPGRLDRGLPDAAGARGRAAEEERRLHAARLRPGAAALAAGAPGHLGTGGRDRLALPDPPAQGRRVHAQPRNRPRQPARRTGRGARRAGRRRHRRDAQRHVRPGVPVLAQADRAPHPGGLLADGVVRGRRPVPRRPRLRPARPGRVGRPAVRAGLAPALHDVLDHHRDLPRHHGPAARGRALLHQPRRPRRPAHHARRARPARHLLRAAARVRRAGPHVRRRPGRRGSRRLRGRRAAAPDGRRHAAASCWPRCSSPARSRRSCRRRPG